MPEIHTALKNAELHEPKEPAASMGAPAENADFVEIAETDTIKWEENSTYSANSTDAHPQKAVFPADSILAEFCDFAVTQQR